MESSTPILRYYLAPAAKAAGAVFTQPRIGDAGFDLSSAQEILLKAGDQTAISTGLYLSIPIGWVGIVRERSSVALQRLYAHAGVIDAAYRGEVRVVVSNGGPEPVQIKPGQRIAQLLIVPCLTAGIEVNGLDDLGSTDRGSGGFGSTG